MYGINAELVHWVRILMIKSITNIERSRFATSSSNYASMVSILISNRAKNLLFVVLSELSAITAYAELGISGYH